MPAVLVRRTETVTVTVVVWVRLSLCWQGGGNAQPGDILPKGGWWWGGHVWLSGLLQIVLRGLLQIVLHGILQIVVCLWMCGS